MVGSRVRESWTSKAHYSGFSAGRDFFQILVPICLSKFFPREIRVAKFLDLYKNCNIWSEKQVEMGQIFPRIGQHYLCWKYKESNASIWVNVEWEPLEGLYGNLMRGLPPWKEAIALFFIFFSALFGVLVRISRDYFFIWTFSPQQFVRLDWNLARSFPQYKHLFSGHFSAINDPPFLLMGFACPRQ